MFGYDIVSYLIPVTVYPVPQVQSQDNREGGNLMVTIFVTVVSVVEFNGLTGICIIVMYFDVWGIN